MKKTDKRKSTGKKKADCVVTPASFGDEVFGEILSEYLSKKISISELARAHGISYKTLYNRYVRENWKEFRENYRKTVVKKTLNRLSNTEALKLRRLMSGCDRLNELIEACLNDADQQFLYEDETGDFKKRSKVNTKYLMEMSLLLEKQTKVTSALYGILTEPEAQHIAIEQAKLESRIAAANAKDGGDSNDTGVILLPPPLPEGEDE